MKKQSIDFNSVFSSEELKKLNTLPPLSAKDEDLMRKLANFLIDRILEDKEKKL